MTRLVLAVLLLLAVAGVSHADMTRPPLPKPPRCELCRASLGPVVVRNAP